MDDHSNNFLSLLDKAIRILCKIFITESPTGYHSIGKVTDKQHATPIC